MGKTYLKSLVDSNEEIERLIITLKDVLSGNPHFIVIHGSGDNGKTTFVRTFAQLFNANDVVHLPSNFMTYPEGLEMLQNKKLAIIHEPDFDESLNINSSIFKSTSFILTINPKPETIFSKELLSQMTIFEFTGTFSDPQFKTNVEDLRELLMS